MVAVAIEVYVAIKKLYLDNSSSAMNAHKKILEKEDGSLLVQDLAVSRIIRKYKLLENEEQLNISRRYHSPIFY